MLHSPMNESFLQAVARVRQLTGNTTGRMVAVYNVVNQRTWQASIVSGNNLYNIRTTAGESALSIQRAVDHIIQIRGDEIVLVLQCDGNDHAWVWWSITADMPATLITPAEFDDPGVTVNFRHIM